MLHVGCGSVGLILACATTTTATRATRPSANSIFCIVAPTRNVCCVCILNFAFCLTSLLLPRIPRAQDLPGDLRLLRSGNRLELLDAAHEAVGEIQMAQLIGRHAVRATKPSGLRAGRAPAIQEVPLLIELENPAGSRLAHPDEAVLIDEMVDGQGFLTGWPVRRSNRPHVQELAVLVEHLHPLVVAAAIDDEHFAIGADRDAVHGVEFDGAG